MVIFDMRKMKKLLYIIIPLFIISCANPSARKGKEVLFDDNQQGVEIISTAIFINGYELFYKCYACTPSEADSVIVFARKGKRTNELFRLKFGDFYFSGVSTFKHENETFLFAQAGHTYGHTAGYLYHIDTTTFKTSAIELPKSKIVIPDSLELWKDFGLQWVNNKLVGGASFLSAEMREKFYLEQEFTLQKSGSRKYELKIKTEELTKDTGSWVNPFDSGLIRFSKDGYFGLVDIEGNIILEPQYDRIFDFFNGVAIVTKNNKYGIINSSGKEVLPPSLSFIFDFGDSADVTIFHDHIDYRHRSGFVTKNGKVIELQKNSEVFSKIGNQFLVTTVLGRESKKFTTYSSKGLPVLEVNWNNSHEDDKYHKKQKLPFYWQYSETGDENTQIQKRNEMRIQEIDIMEKLPVNYFLFFQEGIAIMPKKKGYDIKYCYVNEKGQEVLPTKFINAHLFKNGVAAVCPENSGWGVINTKGEVVIPFEYEYLEVLNEDYLIFASNYKLGIMDFSRKVILEPEYVEIKQLQKDLYALVPYNEEDKYRYYEDRDYQKGRLSPGISTWGVLNIKTGKQILDFEHDHIEKVNDSLFLSLKKNFHIVFRQPTGMIHPIDRLDLKQNLFNSEGVLFTYELDDVRGDFLSHNSDGIGIELESYKLPNGQVFLLKPLEDDKKQWLNVQGQIVTDPDVLIQLDARFYRSQLKVFTDVGGEKVGVKNINGQTVLNPEYDDVRIGFTGIIISKNRKYGFADLTGKILIPIQYQHLEELPSGCLRNSKSLIDKTGNPIN